MQAYLGRWFPLRGVGNTPAKPSDSTCFATAIKRKGKRGNYIVKRGEKGAYHHDDIVTLTVETQQNKGGKREEKGIR